jgi:hypothetical protein
LPKSAKFGRIFAKVGLLSKRKALLAYFKIWSWVFKVIVSSRRSSKRFQVTKIDNADSINQAARIVGGLGPFLHLGNFCIKKWAHLNLQLNKLVRQTNVWDI